MARRARRKGGVRAAPGDRRPRPWADHIPGASGSCRSRQETGTSLATAGGGRVTRCGATAGVRGRRGSGWPLAGAFRGLSCWVHRRGRRTQTRAGTARARARGPAFSGGSAGAGRERGGSGVSRRETPPRALATRRAPPTAPAARRRVPSRKGPTRPAPARTGTGARGRTPGGTTRRPLRGAPPPTPTPPGRPPGRAIPPPAPPPAPPPGPAAYLNSSPRRASGRRRPRGDISPGAPAPDPTSGLRPPRGRCHVRPRGAGARSGGAAPGIARASPPPTPTPWWPLSRLSPGPRRWTLVLPPDAGLPLGAGEAGEEEEEGRPRRSPARLQRRLTGRVFSCRAARARGPWGPDSALGGEALARPQGLQTATIHFKCGRVNGGAWGSCLFPSLLSTVQIKSLLDRLPLQILHFQNSSSSLTPTVGSYLPFLPTPPSFSPFLPLSRIV